jgi:Flp pilus assembly protein TadG
VWVRPLTLRQKLHSFFGVQEEGSQLVEMAVVAPILLVILTGMASFGMALYSQQQLGLAAANAVQAIATGTSLITDPCKTAATDVAQSLPQWTAANISYTLTIYTKSTSSVTASGTGSGFTCTADSADLTTFQPVTLKVTYPYNWFPIFQWTKYGSNFAPTGNLTTTQAAMAQ